MTLRIARRAGILAAATLATVLALGSPAFAHTQITLDPAQAGAPSATMKVDAEAENDAAGIASVQIFMPAGINPAEISLVAGPDGWSAKPAADNVTVSGPALPAKTNAAFSLKLGQLPTSATVLTFKTLVTYTDGKVDRWIGAPGSANPAPAVSLAPGAAVATTGPAIRSEAPAATTPATTPASSPSSNALWWIVAVVVLVIVAIGAWAMARRGRGRPTRPGA